MGMGVLGGLLNDTLSGPTRRRLLLLLFVVNDGWGDDVMEEALLFHEYDDEDDNDALLTAPLFRSCCIEGVKATADDTKGAARKICLCRRIIVL